MTINEKLSEFSIKKVQNKHTNQINSTKNITKAKAYEKSFSFLFNSYQRSVGNKDWGEFIEEIKKDSPKGKNEYCQARRFLVYHLLNWTE